MGKKGGRVGDNEGESEWERNKKGGRDCVGEKE